MKISTTVLISVAMVMVVSALAEGEAYSLVFDIQPFPISQRAPQQPRSTVIQPGFQVTRSGILHLTLLCELETGQWWDDFWSVDNVDEMPEWESAFYEYTIWLDGKPPGIETGATRQWQLAVRRKLMTGAWNQSIRFWETPPADYDHLPY